MNKLIDILGSWYCGVVSLIGVAIILFAKLYVVGHVTVPILITSDNFPTSQVTDNSYICMDNVLWNSGCSRVQVIGLDNRIVTCKNKGDK